MKWIREHEKFGKVGNELTNLRIWVHFLCNGHGTDFSFFILRGEITFAYITEQAIKSYLLSVSET